MSNMTTGVLIFLLVVSSPMLLAKEDSEHLKNISKAVSAQLLRMKQKKKDEQVKSAQNTISSQESKEPSTTIISSSLLNEKNTVRLNDKKSLNKEERAKKEGVKPKKNMSNQQKNDHLRLRIQDLVNSSSD